MAENNVDVSVDFQSHELNCLTEEIPFGNGQWIPIKPEPEMSIYWWAFPWTFKLHDKYDWQIHNGHPESVWKLIAGKTITHLPEHCLEYMTPVLSWELFENGRVAPQVVDFGPHYESVLEYFTERMLGINDYIPVDKRGLLNKLFDETGFVRDYEIEGPMGFSPDLYPI